MVKDIRRNKRAKFEDKSALKRAGRGIVAGINKARRFADEYRESTGLPDEYHPFMTMRPAMFGLPAHKKPPQPKAKPVKSSKVDKRSQRYTRQPPQLQKPQESEEQRRAREYRRYEELLKKGTSPSYAIMQIERERR